MLAPAQITAARITTRTMTKNAVSAAHIIWRCQGVGYSFISQPHRDVVPAPWQLRLTWTSAFGVQPSMLILIPSLGRVRPYRQLFADHLFGVLNLFREIFIFWVERQRFLPGFQCFPGPIQF